ncbi:hypothetical protein ACP70R_021071 [Stipagrostis hirtigluma subsp. patula]
MRSFSRNKRKNEWSPFVNVPAVWAWVLITPNEHRLHPHGGSANGSSPSVPFILPAKFSLQMQVAMNSEVSMQLNDRTPTVLIH